MNYFGVRIQKNHGNKFEFSHEERCTVVHLRLIIMGIRFFANLMSIYDKLSEYPYYIITRVQPQRVC